MLKHKIIANAREVKLVSRGAWVLFAVCIMFFLGAVVMGVCFEKTDQEDSLKSMATLIACGSAFLTVVSGVLAAKASNAVENAGFKYAHRVLNRIAERLKLALPEGIVRLKEPLTDDDMKVSFCGYAIVLSLSRIGEDKTLVLTVPDENVRITYLLDRLGAGRGGTGNAWLEFLDLSAGEQENPYDQTQMSFWLPDSQNHLLAELMVQAHHAVVTNSAFVMGPASVPESDAVAPPTERPSKVEV